MGIDEDIMSSWDKWPAFPNGVELNRFLGKLRDLWEVCKKARADEIHSTRTIWQQENDAVEDQRLWARAQAIEGSSNTEGRGGASIKDHVIDEAKEVMKLLSGGYVPEKAMQP